MLTLSDFSAVLQVVIAFYGVYAAKSRDISNTLIFDIIRDKIKRVHNLSSEYVENAREGLDKLQHDLSGIEKGKLNDPEKELLKTYERGARQEVEIASSLHEKLDIIYNEYVGQTYFTVIAVDMVLLSFTMLVFGILDDKLIWCTDGLCTSNIVFVALLIIHCLIFEYSSHIRRFSIFEPSVIFHAVLIAIFLFTSIVLTEYYHVLCNVKCDIEEYMLIYAVMVILPPIIIVGRNLRLIYNLKATLEDTADSGKWAIEWFYRDVVNYKERYPIEENHKS